MRSRFDNYINNVTLRSRRGGHHDKVVWETRKRYSEKKIADMLNQAYNLGRVEAAQDIEDAVREAKQC